MPVGCLFVRFRVELREIRLPEGAVLRRSDGEDNVHGAPGEKA